MGLNVCAKWFADASDPPTHPLPPKKKEEEEEQQQQIVLFICQNICNISFDDLFDIFL